MHVHLHTYGYVCVCVYFAGCFQAKSSSSSSHHHSSHVNGSSKQGKMRMEGGGDSTLHLLPFYIWKVRSSFGWLMDPLAQISNRRCSKDQYRRRMNENEKKTKKKGNEGRRRWSIWQKENPEQRKRRKTNSRKELMREGDERRRWEQKMWVKWNHQRGRV